VKHPTVTATTHDADRRAEPVVLDHVTIVPIRHGRRTVGAYVMSSEGVRFQQATDVTRIAVAIRRPPAIRSVTMGPGGWVSLKGMPQPPMRSGAAPSRPWWARPLRAHRLVVEHR
jgi:hypothetical protein